MSLEILHVVQILSAGGAGRALLAMARRDAGSTGSRHRVVSMLAPDPRAVALCAEHGIAVTGPCADPRGFMEDADIVLLHWWNCPEMARLLRSDLPPCRLVAWFHVGGNRAPQTIDPELLRHVDFAAACSPGTWSSPAFRSLSERERAERAGMLFAASETDRFLELRKRPHDGFRVGYVGTVDPVKMHPRYVQLSHAVKGDDIRFVVCGGPLHAQLAATAAKLGDPRFEFLGHVDDVAVQLEIMDVFGYPLCEETYAGSELALQEAMASGVPAVVFPHGGLSELVVDGVDGLVVRTEKEYSEAIELLRRDPALLARLSEGARRKAKDRFRPDPWAESWSRVFRDLASRPKRSRPPLHPELARASWGEWLARSFGQDGVPFLNSLHPLDLDSAFDAEADISDATPLLRSVHSGGVPGWSKAFPDDAHLRLWSGLMAERSGDLDAALEHYSRAFECGLNHWRVLWYSARTLAGGGRLQDAANLCARISREVDHPLVRSLARRLDVLDSQTPPPPALPLQRKTESVAPGGFELFSYSRTNHLASFGTFAGFPPIDPETSDLKAYQDHLVLSFLRDNIPPGSRILEVGGGVSRVLDLLKDTYECWNLEPFEGLGSGPTEVTRQPGVRLVRDYLGKRNPELPDHAFDFVFSISALEHVPDSESLWEDILADIERLLAPGGWSLHCFDCIANRATDGWTSGLAPWLSRKVRAYSRWTPPKVASKDPQLHYLRQGGYERYWMPATKKPWDPDTMAYSANILWRKEPQAPARLPRISMVVPSYNQAKFLEETLRSILEQGYPDLQLVVMDGGSTDGSREIIERYADRLHHWESKRDGGQYAAIDEGFRHCDGEIMGWLNSDDILHPFSLWKIAKVFAENPRTRWVMGRPTAWDGDGRLIDVLDVRTWDRKRYLSGDYRWIQQESTFWRSSLWHEAGGKLATELRLAGDLELWTRFFRHATLQVLDGLVGGFRRHGDQKTGRSFDDYVKEAENVLEKERRLVAEGSHTSFPESPAPMRIESIEPHRLLGHGWRARLPGGTIGSIAGWVEDVAGRDAADGIRARMEGWIHPTRRAARSEGSSSIAVSAIVSTYKAEKLLPACMDDLLSQTLWAKGALEIVVVDTGSPQGESEIVKEYQNRHGSERIRFIRTEDRRTLYAAWNLGIRAAKGRYVTNANTDDAHVPHALETMAAALDATAEADFCFCDNLWTDAPNDLGPDGPGVHTPMAYPDWHPATTLMWCTFGPHPMWRRGVFDRVGWFDDSFRSAGDHAFQFRMAMAGCQGVHVPEALSLFFQNPQGVSQSGGDGERESQELFAKWWSGFPLERLYAVDPTDSRACHAGWTDLALRALKCGAPWSTDHAFPNLALIAAANAHAADPSHPFTRGLLALLAYRLGQGDKLPPDLRALASTGPVGQPPAPPPPAAAPLRWTPGVEVQRSRGEELDLHWMAPILNFSGYARMNRDIVAAMDDDGIRPSVTPLDSDPAYAASLAGNTAEIERWQGVLGRPEKRGVFVCSHLPGGFPGTRAANPGHRKYVGLTMFETDRLPAGWADGCMAMDEIWVPSHFNRETFVRAGVDSSRIQVVPYGIDLSKWDPSTKAMAIPGTRGFVFLAVFEWTLRKGWDVLVEAFAKAFGSTDDVCLVLRTRRPANDPTPIRTQIDRHLKSRGIDPAATAPIVLMEEAVPDASMPSLYAAADAIVLPTRGEGWGLPFMEAMAMEKPVVATAWGAHMDFLDDSVGWTIPVETLEDVSLEQTRMFPLYGSDHKWARPSVEALVGILRELPSNRSEVRKRGVAGRGRLARDWTPERCAAWIRNRFGDLGKQESSQAPVAGGSPRSPIPPRPVIRAGFFDYSGYSRLARDAALEMDRRDFAPKIEAFTGDQAFLRELSSDREAASAFQRMIDTPETDGIGIAWFPPTTWQDRDVYELFREWHPRSRRNVAMTMFETDRISGDWACRCNGMDEIWVPSRFNVETFAASGVERSKLRVIPLGLRLSDYDPDRIRSMELPGSGTFTFLSVFQWSLRKGWDLLLEAFAREFAANEDVRLVLRTYPSGRKDPPIRERIDTHLGSLGLGAVSKRIHLVEEFVSDERMPSLLAACDAFVLPTRGEGWGIPFMEAMALAKPVIATRWSGHLDFMDDGNSFLVDIEGLENVQDAMRDDNDLYAADHRWAKPSLAHLRSRMREVYTDRDKAASVGRRARADILRDRDVSRTAAWIRERCAEVDAPALPARTPRGAIRTVAVDARCLFDRDSTDRGIGHYTHSHLKAIERCAPDLRFLFLAPEGADPSLVAEHLGTGRVEIVPLAKFRPGMADLLHLPDPMGERPDGLSPFAIPFDGPRSTVFYDLIPLRFYRNLWSPAANDIYRKRMSQALEFDGRHLCISHSTRDDLVAVGARPDRVGWIGAGLNQSRGNRVSNAREAESLFTRLGIRGQFFLQVGALDQHKNFKASLDCFQAVRERTSCQLVVVGRKIHSIAWWADFVAKNGIQDVIFTDFLSREDLEILYAHATSLLFLSWIEGFGFPALEAMAQGCPVVAYANSSLPEVCGDAAFLVPDGDESMVVRAMTALLGNEDLRVAHAKAGIEQAKRFRWEDVARRTLAEWGCPTGGGIPVVETAADGPAMFAWAAPVYDPSGYGDEARGFLRELDRDGVLLAARSAGRRSESFREGMGDEDRERFDRMLDRATAPGCPLVISFPAHGYRRFDGFGHHVGRTMFETDGLPPSWVESCNRMDEIWVPTEFNLRTFREAGVTVPLLKVPGGVDSRMFRPGAEPLPVSGSSRGTTYLSIFEWTHRKAPDVLLAGWARAFGPKDDVRLVLRAYPLNGIEGDPTSWVEAKIDETLRAVGRARKDCAPIVVLGKQVPDALMPRLYAAADVYLAPSRGEGWGRPHMEAMACGVPVIATRWSGNLEFQDDDNSWLIDVDGIVEVGSEMEFEFYRGQKWAEPSVESFTGLLRRSWKGLEERKAKGARARADIESRWDWSRIARIARIRLREIAEGIPARASAIATTREEGRIVEHVSGRRLSGVLATIARGLRKPPPAPQTLAPRGAEDDVLSIRWEGSQFVHHSLAHVNRELCAGLAKRGHDLSLVPYEPDQFGPGIDPDLQILRQLADAPLEGACQIHVRHQWPPNLTPPAEGRWVVAQPWEFGSPPKEWMRAFRDQIDELWAYTNYVRDMYVRAGVPADRVHVVPLGVDVDRFRPGLAPLASLPEKGGVRFLYVGGSIARKGFDVLLNAWQKAFGPDDPVELLIKDMGGKTTYAGQTGERFVRQIQDSGRFARIHYVNDDLAPSDLPGLYASGDVLVHPYRGEGFGLPIAEAMSCGLPVIITSGGAADDFCGPDEGWMIPAGKVRLPGGKVDQMETVEPAWWLEPSESALIAALREAAHDALARRRKGEAGRRRIVGNFTWKLAVDAAEARLRAVAQRPIRRVGKLFGEVVSIAPAKQQQVSTSIDSMDDLSERMFEIEMLVARQDFAQAAILSAEAVERHPHQSAPWLVRAMVLRALKKTGQALGALNKALAAGGGAEVHFEMLALHLQMGKMSPARLQWNILKEKYPDWIERHREEMRKQGQPWLPDRLDVASKPKPKSPKARKR